MLLNVCLTINGRTPHILIGHLVPRDHYFSCPFTVSQVTRAPATPCPVPFFSSHLSSPFPSASVAPGSFRCCRPPPCRFPLLRAFLPASVPHPGTRQLRLFFDPLSFSTSLDSDCTIAWRQFICLLGFDYVRVSMMATVRRWR